MKKNSTYLLRSLVALSILFFGGLNPLYSQTVTATLIGRTLDQAGAALPGVSITLTQLSSRQTRSVTSDGAGNFSFLLVPVGRYSLSAERDGFQKLLYREFDLQVDQRADFNLTLSAGRISETVEVNSAASPLQSETATLGTVIDREKIIRLPLNGREFQQLALLVPGAVPAAQGSSLSFRGGFNVGGARESANQFLLDGADNNNSSANQYVFRPSVDMIQEFKVQTNTYSAEFGRGAGAQVNIVTKSGTNDFHGNAFEFLRNSALDAKNFFDLPGTSPSFKRNQFGATFGGPLPFLHFGEGGPIIDSGKDRMFFFVSYEGLRLRQGVTRTASVPTALQRQGNFGPSARIRDPQRAGNCSATDTSACFPDGIIPPERFNAIGFRIAGYFPLPNATDPVRNFVSTLSRPQDADQLSIRIDRRLTSKASLLFRYSVNEDQQIDVFDSLVGTINTNLPGYGRNDNQLTKSLSLSYTQIINSKTVNEFRFGYNLLRQIRAPEDKTDYVTLLGLTGLASDPRTFGFPAFRVTGFDPLGNNVQLPQERTDTTLQFVENVSLQRGGHTIKTGFDLRPFRSENFNPGSSRGDFRFTGLYTNNGLADLLLGLIAQDTFGVGNAERVRLQKSYGFYVQDDWKVSRRLTFNLGLRYELNPPLTEPSNLLSNFDPQTRSIIVAGQNGIGRGVYNTDKNNFAPRVGFAWQPFTDGKTVIRGGYGIYYDLPIVGNEFGGIYGNPPFRATNTFNGTLAVPISLNNPFPSGQLGAATLSPTAVERNLKTSYLQNFSLGVQREIFEDTVVEVTYVGNKGTNLIRTRNINQALLGTGSIASRRPIAGFGNINYREASANSIYHSMQARAERRFSQGFTLLAAYTFSKSIDDSSGVPASTGSTNNPQNSYDLRAERGLSEFDIRHRFVASFIYELPFGKGKRFLPDGIASQIFGNFEISGIVVSQTGRPFTPRISADRSNTGQLQDRPNLIGDPRLSNPDPALWFNIAAFSISAPGTATTAGRFGSAGRNILIGPGYNSTDIALVKRIRFGEASNLELRAEAFNVFNTPNFDLPNTTVDSNQFGRIFSAGPSRQIQFGVKFNF